MHQDTLRQAADLVATADALVIAAGAGMGVDSGLPDFRGAEGFWRAYPPFAKLGLRFEQLANPRWFVHDPPLAWGFYGHRMNLYRQTTPHAGFAVLKRWADRMPKGWFVHTSNVDAAFQKAGFDPQRIFEVHGAFHFLQCMNLCGIGLISAAARLPNGVDVDEETMRAREPLPSCPACGGLARPNILMFNDGGWDESFAYQQERRLSSWMHSLGKSRLVVIECGAGTAVPTVRYFCESVCEQFGGKLIRINVREPQVPPGHVGLPMGALAAIRALEEQLVQRGW